MKSISEVEDSVNRDVQFGNSKFVIFQEIEWLSTGGVDMDALPTKPVSVPLSRIRELRPAKTWKTWDNTVEIRTSDNRIAVRGTVDEIVSKLNEPDTRDAPDPRKPFAPFALTPREERLHRMREDGYSLNEIALAFNTGGLRIAKDLSVIDKKLEAAASRRRPPMDEVMDGLHSGAGRIRICAWRETMAMMRDPNIHPDATT
jgi:DNA-binding CsgD family transcriptional regulator